MGFNSAFKVLTVQYPTFCPLSVSARSRDFKGKQPLGTPTGSFSLVAHHGGR